MSAKPRRAPKSKALAPTPPPMETAAGTPGFADQPQASFHNALTMSTTLFEPFAPRPGGAVLPTIDTHPIRLSVVSGGVEGGIGLHAAPAAAAGQERGRRPR